jgi:DNA repair protein RadD
MLQIGDVTFRPHQVEAADAIEAALAQGIKRPLVDMCVGSGKSLTMGLFAHRRWHERGERSIISAHTRELVSQNADACRKLGLRTGINAAALGERTWRAPVISAGIHSIFKDGRSFGDVTNLLTDECHLIPHDESGMYRQLARAFPNATGPGFTGTTFRLQGGSLVEGEEAPFDKVVYTYSILDGIQDGYLVPAFSAPADDVIDASKLRTAAGDFTGASQDAQNIALMDNHIAQMVHHGARRRAWLVFEASKKSAIAMAKRLNEWGVPTGLILDNTPPGREGVYDPNTRWGAIALFKAGRLRCLVNIGALTTGFDAQITDMLVMRRKTKSLGLYIQMIGRLLRTIGGNIDASIAAGKADGLVLDFAGNIDEHGPLDDVIQPAESKSRLVECEECGKRNGAAAARCWSCDALMTKVCPGCTESVTKGTLKCPHCEYEMRTGGAGTEPKPQTLLEKPSAAALISSFGAVAPKAGGWLPVRKVWHGDGLTVLDANGDRWSLPAAFEAHAKEARWIRGDNGVVVAVLKRNGNSHGSAIQVTADGLAMPVPMPAAA